jgi:3-oxoadipate enol-lactonase
VLAYDSHGSGFPLLLLHGALVSRAMWRPQLGAFSRVRRVLTCDLPAHGASADVAGPYTVAEVSRHVLALLDSLGIARLDLCGHSLGGMVAQQLAATQPERVGKLVLAETALGTRDSPSDRLATALARPLLHLTPQRALVAVSAKRYGSLNRPVAEFIRREMRAYSRQTTVRVMGAAFGFSGRALVGKIGAPTLVLIAGENRQTHRQGGELARLLADAQLHVVPGAHHLLNLDRPEFFNRTVLEFLDR